jgi:hypothetical protein
MVATPAARAANEAKVGSAFGNSRDVASVAVKMFQI